MHSIIVHNVIHDQYRVRAVTLPREWDHALQDTNATVTFVATNCDRFKGIRWWSQKPCQEYAASHSVGKSSYILPREGGFSLDRPVVEGGRVNLYTGCHMTVITSVLEVMREHSASQSQRVGLKAGTWDEEMGMKKGKWRNEEMETHVHTEPWILAEIMENRQAKPAGCMTYCW